MTTTAFTAFFEYFFYCVAKVILQLFNVFILHLLFHLSDQNNAGFYYFKFFILYIFL